METLRSIEYPRFAEEDADRVTPISTFLITYTAAHNPLMSSRSTNRGAYALFSGCNRIVRPSSSKYTRLNVVSLSRSRRTKQSLPPGVSSIGLNTTMSPSR
jgi:hypothetical protein